MGEYKTTNKKEVLLMGVGGPMSREEFIKRIEDIKDPAILSDILGILEGKQEDEQSPDYIDIIKTRLDNLKKVPEVEIGKILEVREVIENKELHDSIVIETEKGELEDLQLTLEEMYRRASDDSEKMELNLYIDLIKKRLETFDSER